MQIKAVQKNTRQSPRKVRLLANQIKDLPLDQAFTQLALMERRGSLVLLKVFRQAVANAVNNHQLTVADLEIERVVVKTGPTYKRMRPVSRGRAHRILKRTCHVEVVLRTKAEVKPTAAAVKSKQDKKIQEKAKAKTVNTKSKAGVKKTDQVSTVKKKGAQSTKSGQKPQLKDTHKVTKSVKQTQPAAPITHRKASTSR